MFTFTKCYLGLVNQKENYRRLQNVGAKTEKKKIFNTNKGIWFTKKYKTPLKIIILCSVARKKKVSPYNYLAHLFNLILKCAP